MYALYTFCFVLPLFGCFAVGNNFSIPLEIRQEGFGPQGQDPFDHSWITRWAAVGDSYASGIGAGPSRGSCGRHTLSYPSLINSDASLGDSADRVFTDVSCAGATIPQIIDQINGLEGRYDMITISAGGNDIRFRWLVNACIYQIIPADCDAEVHRVRELLSPRFMLPRLGRLIDAAREKLAYRNSRVFFLGYTPFFDTTDDACDTVSWAFISPRNRERLTVEHRRLLNELADILNARIREAVSYFGDVVFVDWEHHIDTLGGKFCVPGADETLRIGDNRENLAFYNYYSTLDESAEEDANVLQVEEYASELATDIENLMREDEEETERLRSFLPEAYEDIQNTTAIAAILSDNLWQVFHPQSIGHTRMAYAVLSALELEQARGLGQPSATTTMVGCPAPTSIATRPGRRDFCYSDRPLGNGIAFPRSRALGHIDEFCRSNAGRDISPDGGMRSSYPHDETMIHIGAVRHSGEACRGRLESEQQLTDAECVLSLRSALDSCDTNTREEKHGGAWLSDCIAYYIEGTRGPPTVSVDAEQGILTCASANHDWEQGDQEHYMSSMVASNAAVRFCDMLVATALIDDPPRIIEPDGSGSYIRFEENGVVGQLRFHRNDNCPPEIDLTSSVELCIDRMLVLIRGCDTEDNGHEAWKAGGEFFRDCMTWGIARNEDTLS